MPVLDSPVASPVAAVYDGAMHDGSPHRMPPPAWRVQHASQRHRPERIGRFHAGGAPVHDV
uniref:Uncharacterized protein n=1 Tax=Oryza glumipatula TaxID=40148 RepID=A0A0D9Z6W5_9ORYZ